MTPSVTITPSPLTLNVRSTPSAAPTNVPWLIEDENNFLLFANRLRNNDHAVYLLRDDGSSQFFGYGDLIGGQPWSPDGTKIILLTGRNADQLGIINVKSGTVDSLFLDSNSSPSSVYWSPDGNHLLYPIPADGAGNFTRLVLYNLVSEESKFLTEPSRILSVAGWSSNGDKIAYVTEKDGQFDIYVLETDNLSISQITNSDMIETEVKWSPTSDDLLFGTTFTNELPETGSIPIKELYVVDSITLGLNLLGDFYFENPEWSPNGDRIAFTRAGICILEIDDGSENCADQEFSEAHSIFPSWSTKEDYIAFRASTTLSQCYTVFIFELNTNQLIEARVGQNPCGSSRLYWKP